MRLKNMAIARDILHKEFGEPFFPRSVVDKVDAFLLGINIGKKDAVKHGHWILKGFGNAECSVCGHYSSRVYDDDNADRYCRHCGAKMDGENNESK